MCRCDLLVIIFHFRYEPIAVVHGLQICLHILCGLGEQLQILWLYGCQYGYTFWQTMVWQHFRVLWHSHCEHRWLLEALHRQLHVEILKFWRRLYLIRIEHLNLHRLLSIARLFARHRNGQYEGLRLRYIRGGSTLLRLILKCCCAVDGTQKLDATIGA